MNTKTFSLNRDPSTFLEAFIPRKEAPLWTELVSAEEIQGSIAGIDSNLEGIANAFSAKGTHLSIEAEPVAAPQLNNRDQGAPVGWIKGLEVRHEDTLWGLMTWNDQGYRIVHDNPYQCLSLIFTYDTQLKLILQLHSAGFSHQTNLHLATLNQHNKCIKDEAVKLAPATCVALDLPEQATQAQAISATNPLKQDTHQASDHVHDLLLTQCVPCTDDDALLRHAQVAETTLEESVDTPFSQQVDIELANALAKGVITTETVNYHRACCDGEDDLAQFKEFVASTTKTGRPSNLADQATRPTAKQSSQEDKIARLLRGIDDRETT